MQSQIYEYVYESFTMAQGIKRLVALLNTVMLNRCNKLH